MPGLSVHRQLSAFTETQVRWIGDAFQASHPLSSPSSPTFSLSQHQGDFRWVWWYIKGCVLSACLFTCRVHHVKYKTEDADDTILKMPESRKSESEKTCLKTQRQKTEIMASGPITSWQIDGGNTGNSDRLSLLGRQSHCRWGLQPWN